MNHSARFAKGLIAATIVAAFIYGCGDTPPPPKRADSEIRSGRDSIDNGDLYASKGDYDQAVSSYTSALSTINDGRKFAEGTDKTTLKSMYDEANQKISDAEAAQLRKKNEPQKPKAVAEVVKKQDEQEKKLAAQQAKKDAADKKKADEDRKALESLASTGKDSKGGKVDEAPTGTGAVPVEPNKSKEKGIAAADDEADKKAAAEAASAILKAKDPYPAVTEKSPEIEVIKIGYAGTKYVYAYFQIYNKEEGGKTINAVNAFFKDKDNQTVIDRGYTFPFEGFRPNAKDMVGDQGTDALTLGSHKIDGCAARRFVVIGEGDRAKDAKKVAVKVIYDDGKAPWVQFPDK